MVEITINIKTKEYLIRMAKMTSGGSAVINLPKHLIGLDVLCIPLMDRDMIIVNEDEDGMKLINCCGMEMLYRTVKPHLSKTGTNGNGNVFIPIGYLTDDVVVIPLD